MTIQDRVASSFFRKRKADYGDVEAYYSVFDFFSHPDRQLEHDEVLMLQGMMQEAIHKTSRKREDLIRRALKSNSADRKTLEAHGIELK